MKTLFFCLICFFPILLFGQDSTQLQRDTARANRLYEDSDSLRNSDPRKLELLEEAVALYAKHPFMMVSMPLKSDYLDIYRYQTRDHASVDSMGLAIIQEVVDDGHGLYHGSLYLVYRKIAVSAYWAQGIEKMMFYLDEAIKAAANTDRPENNLCHAILIKAFYRELSGDLKRFLPLLKEAEKMIKSTPSLMKDRVFALFFYLKTVYYMDYTSEFERAIIMSKKREQYLDKENDNIMSRHFFDLAKLYALLEDQPQTHLNLEKGTFLIEKMRKDPTIGYRTRLFSYLYLEATIPSYIIGDYEMSNRYAQKAIEVDSTTEDEENIAFAYFRIGMNYINLQEYEKSVEAIKKALSYDCCTQKFNYLTVYAEALMNIGDYQQVLTVLQQIYKNKIADFDPTSIYDNPPFEDTDLLYFEWNIYLKAKTLYLKSLAGTEPNYEELQFAIENFNLKLKQLDFEKANHLRSSESSFFINNERRSNVAKMLIRAYHHFYAKDQNSAYSEEMLRYAEIYKGQALIESLYKENIPSTDLQTDAEYLSQIRLLEQDVAFADSSERESYEEQLYSATEDYHLFQHNLKEKYALSSEKIRAMTFPGSETIRANLAEKGALLSYIKKESELFIFLFTKDNYEIIKVPIAENFAASIETIKKIIQNPLNLTDDKREKFIQQSHQMYDWLIAPVASQLADIQQLTIIPDDELFYLPFEVLLKSDESKPYHELDYLIKDFAISYNYSASIHVQNQQKKADLRDYSFLGFAPVFGEGQAVAANRLRSLHISVDSLQNSIRNNAFMYLPNTKKELTEIEKILPANEKTTLLLETAATKDAVYNLMEQPYHFLHFATHGIVNPKESKYSSLITYMEDENSLDRFLFVNEIQAKKIQADLVVLSSCESGIGDLATGEGLIALNRGFIYSGAKNVLNTLWKINDKYSSDLMIDFYKNYLKSGSYAKALQAAKVNFLEDERTANPRYWAAFQLIGE